MVRKDLTEKMLERLSKVDDEHKEKGSATDPTRLINSWKATTLAEKTLLEDLVHDHHHEWKGTAGKYKAAKYEDLGVFTDKVLREALNNIIKRKKDQLGKRAESKLHGVVCSPCLPCCDAGLTLVLLPAVVDK